MIEHETKQLAHFADIDHKKRYHWQTKDTFVVEQELVTMGPFIDAIRSEERTHGPLRILESGCGEGVNQAHLRMSGIQLSSIEGVDISPEAVAEAVRHGMHAHIANGLALPYEDAVFDVVFCRDVLHHLEGLETRQKFFKEMQRVCKPGGLIVAIEPNARNIMIWGLSIIVPAERGLRCILESHITQQFPDATVYRVSPSAAWRLFLYYKSPLTRPMIMPCVRAILHIWTVICQRVTPSLFWSYRVYIWRNKM